MISLQVKLYILAGLLTAFLYEHFARLNGLWQFSVPLAWLANQTKELCFQCGRWIATLSGFLNYINMEEVMKTLESLLKPLWLLVTSPYEMLVGYYRTAKDFSHPLWVYWGSGLLIITFYGLWYRYYGHPPWILRIHKRWKTIQEQHDHAFVHPETDDAPVETSPNLRKRRT